jgi:uncharacterized BrkB/YihY/UPF0761 family membrane protein
LIKAQDREGLKVVGVIILIVLGSLGLLALNQAVNSRYDACLADAEELCAAATRNHQMVLAFLAALGAIAGVWILSTLLGRRPRGSGRE